VETFVIVFLCVGFLVGVGLYAWAAVSSVRRHGPWAAVRSAARTYVEELSHYWRVPVVAWTFVLAAPAIAGWAALSGEFDLIGAIFVFVLWLLYLGLLTWHYRARGRRSRRRVGAP